jgi:glycosyltransferase involved in cell wall biosynthesis
MTNIASLETASPVDHRDVLLDIASGLHVPERIVLPTSWVGHIPFASWIVKALRPRIVVELGVHTGNSFFTFAEAASHFDVPAILYGIDTWAGDDHAGTYAEEVFVDVNGVAQSRFPHSVRLVRKLFEDAVDDFQDGSIDLLHIDGLHTYDAVKQDFETWRSKLSDRAVVLFHDIAVTEEGFGVARFWTEMEKAYPGFAFRHSNGLGVLLVGQRVPAHILAYASGSAHDALITLFAKLGDFLVGTIESGPSIGALPINAYLDPPRVYVAADGAFDEAHAVDAKPLSGSPGTLQCRLPVVSDAESAVLRIDPMNHLGMRAVHRVLIFVEGQESPIELVASPMDRRERLAIVPIELGTVFLGIEEDSQWFPQLSPEARRYLALGATLAFEPIAAPLTSLGRMLLRSAQSLAAPLEHRLAELMKLERLQALPPIEELQELVESQKAQLADTQARLEGADVRADRALAELAQESALKQTLEAELSQESALKLALQAELVQAAKRAKELRTTTDEDVNALLEFVGAAHGMRSRESIDATTQIAERLALHDNATVRSMSGSLMTLFEANEVAKGRHVVERQRRAISRKRPRPLVGDKNSLLLEPIRGLAPLDESGRHWRALDGDPQFAFEQLTSYAGHWIELTIGLVTNERSGNAVIYLDQGDGLSERTTVAIPRASRGAPSVAMIFLVPPGLRNARFDPCSVPTDLALNSLQIRAISKWQAIWGMARLMRRTGSLKRFQSVYLPQWRSMRSPVARGLMKRAFVEAYGETLQMRGPNYGGWIEMFEPGANSYPMLESKRERWGRQPLISVLVPTYNTPARFLREAIESVLNQNYRNWELCIADDGSTARHVRKMLKQYQARDRRIKVVFRGSNGHISAASNSALELVSGEFIALLDHDDRLHPLALHYVAETIVANPAVKMIYSDEDKLDPSGRRHSPYFKSDFNRELFLAQNMVTHLGCYATETVRGIGGFRIGLEGSQDWDLALRVCEVIDPSQIVHIPRVLYHWRELPGSTAASLAEKPYAHTAGRRAVEDHLKRQNIEATVHPVPGLPMWNKVRYAIPGSPPKVTIVIPTRDKVEVLKTCVDSVLQSTYPNFDVIIVDNGSTESASIDYFESLPRDRITVLRDDSPFNYSSINNRAVEQASGDLICLLNNDIEVINRDWLEEMVAIASQDSIGIVGARLWYPDFRLQHAGVILGIGGVAGHGHRLAPKGDPGYFGRAALPQQLSAVTGACLLIKRALWDALGGLDETLGVAFNDIDLCLRAGVAGYRTVWTPFAELIHYESISRGAEDTPEKIARFTSETALMRSRWGHKLEEDPFYSPNLTLIAEDYSISWHPRVS